MARTLGTSQTSNYSGVDLRASIQAIQAAGSSGNVAQLAYAVANALTKLQADSQSQNQRLRDMGEPLVSDPTIPAKLLVSGDRVTGGLQVGGQLANPVGQSVDVQLLSGAGLITSTDHTAGPIATNPPAITNFPTPQAPNLPLMVAGLPLLLSGIPAVTVFTSSTQTVATGVWTPIHFDNTGLSHPANQWHNNVTNNQKLTFPGGGPFWTYAGYYIAICNVTWGFNTSATIGLGLGINGSTSPVLPINTNASVTLGSVNLVAVVGTGTISSADTDLEFLAFQASGSNQTLSSANAALFYIGAS